jgi:hypothetical protein
MMVAPSMSRELVFMDEVPPYPPGADAALMQIKLVKNYLIAMARDGGVRARLRSFFCGSD